MILQPVISQVPSIYQSLSGPDKVIFLSNFSREVLKICAKFSNIPLGNLEKNPHGAPIPCNGYWWSVSHKPEFVAAVLCSYPAGIDVEEIKPRKAGVIQKVISLEEMKLNKSPGFGILDYFFRVWTSKESVLKAEGIGLRGLGRCKVIEAPDRETMLLEFEGRRYQTNHLHFKGHIFSVINRGEEVKWIIT